MASRKHPGTIERRGDSLRVILYAAGKPYRYTLNTTDLREAREFAKKKDAELERLRMRVRAGLPARMHFSALLTKFAADRIPQKAPKTQLVYQLSLDAFRAFFVEQMGDPRVDEVHAGHVEEFLTWRSQHRQKDGAWLAAPLSNRTVQKDRTVLHGLFAFAARLRWREGNPVAETEAPKAEERQPVILSDAEWAALLAAIGPDRPMLRLFALTLNETGARCESEALWLRWEDVDFSGGFLAIVSGRDGHRTKAGKSRFVPMTAALTTALRAHFARYRFASYAGQPTPWVFHHELSRRHHEAGARVRSFRDGFLAAATRAGISGDFRQHDLRHRRVTTWLAEGGAPALVQAAMGHTSAAVTERYKHLVPGHLLALVEGNRPMERPIGLARDAG